MGQCASCGRPSRRVGAFTFDVAQPRVIVGETLAGRPGSSRRCSPRPCSSAATRRGWRRDRILTLKYLRVPGVDVVICDRAFRTTCTACSVRPSSSVRPPGGRGSGELVLRPKERPGVERPGVLTLREVRRHRFESFVNDLSVDRAGAPRPRASPWRRPSGIGRSTSARSAVRRRPATPAISPRSSRSRAARGEALVAASRRGVDRGESVRTDRRSPAAAGTSSSSWCTRAKQPGCSETFGWSVRRARFSRTDASSRSAHWTPQNAVGNQSSDPSAIVYTVGYGTAEVLALPAQAPVSDATP